MDENAYLSINERNCNPVEIKQSSTLSSVIVNFLQKSYYQTESILFVNGMSTAAFTLGCHEEIVLVFDVFHDCYKPNSITLASSELAPNMFEAGSCQIPLH